MILLAADTGMRPVQLQQQRLGHATYIREILHAFNDRGLDSVRAQYHRPKPMKFNEAVQKQIVDLVITPPDHLGFPFGQWSVPKRRDSLIAKGIVESISLERLRWILHRNKISYQQSKTWKQSPVLEFDAK